MHYSKHCFIGIIIIVKNQIASHNYLYNSKYLIELTSYVSLLLNHIYR